MKRLIQFLCLLILVQGVLPAAPVFIRGTASQANGQVIRAYVYDDLISFRKLLVAKDTVDDRGLFALKFDMRATGFVSLAIGFHQSELLVKGGETYTLQITAFQDSQTEGAGNTFPDHPYLSFILQDAISHSLNLVMDSLNTLYDDHLLKNFRNLSRGGRLASADTLEKQFRNAVPVSDPFLDAAISYRLAMLEDLMRSAGRERLFQRYLEGQPILYSHPDYMEFFNSFFSRYITHVSRRIPPWELAYRVNEERSYASVLDLLGRDSLLKSENIRELVLLRNLREMYHSPDFNPQSVLHILEQMRSVTRFEEHRRIALNLGQRLTHMRKGATPPPMTFFGAGGDSLMLPSLAGKYLYIQFYTSECTACLADRAAIDALHKRFSSDVAFLGVSVDVEPAVFHANQKRETHEWPLVHFGNDYELIEALDIRAFPTYLLLDRNGRVLSYPARSPADQAEPAFQRLLSAERRQD